MAEYTAPQKVSNFVATRLLSNMTNSSVMLELYDTTDADLYTTKPAISQLEDTEVVFYNDVVVKDVLSPIFNDDIINGYITDGILSDILVSPKEPNVKTLGLSNSSHSITKDLKKINQKNNTDHLEVCYSTDVNNKIKLLVYKDFDGLSYSLDEGVSSIKITSTGLTYPNEITSIAIQNYQYSSVSGIPKIWIGTLREGLKSYLLGSDSWISESDLEKTDLGEQGTFLFRRSLLNPMFGSDPLVAKGQYDVYFKYAPGDYEPVYILGIINNPISAGIPLVTYVNTHKEDILLGLSNTPKCLFRYLLPTAPIYTLDSVYNVYRQTQESLDLSWKPILPLPTRNELVDVLKIVQYKPSQEFTAADSGVLAAISVYSREHNKFCVELLTITATSSIGTVGRKVSITKDPDININIPIESNKFSGLSTLDDIVFITELDRVWRKIKNTWELWIESQGTIPERNLRLTPDYKFAITNAISYLSGLKGFGVLPQKIQDTYIGILNTDLGHVIVNLKSTTEDKLTVINSSKAIKKELFGTSVRDFQVISETSQAISCGLASEPLTKYAFPSVFGAPSRSFLIEPITSTQLPNNLSNSIKTIFYKNYSCGTDNNYTLINKNTIFANNTDQIYDDLNTERVLVVKSFPSAIDYVNDFGFSWLLNYGVVNVSPAAVADLTILRNYLSGSAKYNRLKFLLRATEKVKINESLLEADIEVPYTPEIKNQILGVIPPFLPDDVYGIVESRFDTFCQAIGNVVAYSGASNLNIPVLGAASGVCAVIGTAFLGIPIIALSDGYHVRVIGTSDSTILLNAAGIGQVDVLGSSEVVISVYSEALGITNLASGVIDTTVNILFQAIGGTSELYGTIDVSIAPPTCQATGVVDFAGPIDVTISTISVNATGYMDPVGYGGGVLELTAQGTGYMDPVGWGRNFVMLTCEGVG